MHVSYRAAPKPLSLAMNVSLGTGVLMLAIKWWAYLQTGSSVIFSDAAESVVHIIAVWFAWFALRVAVQPPDNEHHYGHQKIAEISAGTEGALICIAACVIVITSVQRLVVGVELSKLDIGIGITAVAGLLNTALGIMLVRVGKNNRSILVEANGKHVLTDAWTSAGAVLGLVLARITGIYELDPILAIVFGLNILHQGGKLVLSAVTGLMDRTDQKIEETTKQTLDVFCKEHGVTYHRLRLRMSGTQPHLDFHMQFPDAMSIQKAHSLATEAERAVCQAIGADMADVITHLEPLTQPDGHV